MSEGDNGVPIVIEPEDTFGPDFHFILFYCYFFYYLLINSNHARLLFFISKRLVTLFNATRDAPFNALGASGCACYEVDGELVRLWAFYIQVYQKQMPWHPWILILFFTVFQIFGFSLIFFSTFNFPSLILIPQLFISN